MDDRALILLIGLGLLLAGCVGGDPEQDATTAGTDEDPSTDADGLRDPAENASTDRDPASLEEPPEWEVGEWWTVEIGGGDEPARNVTQVVTARHGDTYHVGAAAEDFNDAVVLNHWPPLGEIGMGLTWSVHNTLMEPFRFPLEEGKSWETDWWGFEGHTAEVLSVDGLEATLRVGDGTGDNGTYTYDAGMETITSFRWNGDSEHRVTGHGTGFEGEVVVPHGRVRHFTARGSAAFGPEAGPQPCHPPAPCGSPATPTASVDVSQPEASVALLAESTDLQNASTPGYFRETATSPDGETFQLQTTGTEGLAETTAHASDADGTWEFEHLAGGHGFVGTEIVAYEQLTVNLDGGGSAGTS